MSVRERILGLLFLTCSAWSQDAISQDSVARIPPTKKEFYKSLFVPTALISSGLLIKGSDHGLDFIVRDARNETLPDFHTSLDDYLPFVPIAAVYGLDVIGIKSENNFLDRTSLLIKSEIFAELIVYPLKKYSNVLRPDGTSDDSFPSGHTARAFVAATFMHKELGGKSVWYSIGAYSCATAVGALRILNNRHWLSDVLVGAGIGIFSTHLAYYTHRYKWPKKSARAGRALVVPTYGLGPGVYAVYQFR